MDSDMASVKVALKQSESSCEKRLAGKLVCDLQNFPKEIN